MELELDSLAAQGLSRYLRLVTDELGLASTGSYIQWEPPANVYLALHDRLPLFPTSDVALVWHEERGWAIGIETDASEDLIIMSYLPDDVLPAPRVVAEFARDIVAGEHAGRSKLSMLRRRDDDDDLHARLIDYARVDTSALWGQSSQLVTQPPGKTRPVS
jgi:hypothetical protein